ncbi:MAG TPA: hypothetical protein V6D22_10455 [Candidatus Obscuribacterales bacterium]
MGAVSFGKRNRIRFTPGGTLKEWQPPSGAAIYAVTYQQDPVTRPKSHSVLYFGETADLAKQAAVIREKLHSWWENNGGTGGELYIFYHEMPGSSQNERVNVQHQLVVEYDPRGNN